MGILVTWKVLGSFDFSGTPDLFQSAQIKPRQIVVQRRHANDNDYQPHVPEVSALHMQHLFFHLSSDGSLVESKLFTLQHVTVNTSTLARSA